MANATIIHKPYMVLKGKMKEKGVVYAEIANHLGITATTFSQKVNGKSDFTISEAEMVRAYLDADSTIFS